MSYIELADPYGEPMTVGKLIAELSAYDSDAVVRIGYEGISDALLGIGTNGLHGADGKVVLCTR